MIPKCTVEAQQVVVIDGQEFFRVDNWHNPMEIVSVQLKIVTDLLPNVGASISDISCIYCHQALVVLIFKGIENVCQCGPDHRNTPTEPNTSAP